MTEKLTWAEFAEKYKPKDHEKFLDDRGNEWTYLMSRESFVSNDALLCVRNGKSGYILTCPLIPPKKNRKVWPAMVRFHFGDCWHISRQLFESETQVKEWFNRDATVLWPAIPGPDGSYEVPE